MPAIETNHLGIRFRSRLEARWAVALDALELPWEYEIQGYRRGSTCYLPDFWLPTLGCWIEIKPSSPMDAIEKCSAAVWETGHDLFIFAGQFDQDCFPMAVRLFRERHAVNFDDGYTFTRCPFCEQLAITFNGWADRVLCACCAERELRHVDGTLGVSTAAARARIARFEHRHEMQKTKGVSC